MRPASHWRQKTSGHRRATAATRLEPECPARQRGNPGSEPIIGAAYAAARRPPRALPSAHGHLHDAVPRLQGVVRRRAGDPRAAARRRSHRATTAPADVAVINTCCVTNEAVAKSRQAAAQAARTHERVYVTGCAANLSERRSRGCPRTSASSPGAARSSPSRRRRCRRDRVRPGRSSARRVRAFVKIQDGCSFSCAFCVIPLVRGATRSRSADAVLAEIRRRVGAGPSGGRAHRGQPRVLPRPGGGHDARRAHPSRGRDRGPRAASPVVDRDQPRHPRPDRRDARDAGRLAPPPRPAAVGRRRRAARHGPPLHDRAVRSRLEGLEDFNLTTDVIVGFPTEDEGAFAKTMAAVEARDHEGARLPVLAAARNATAARRPVPQHVKRERSARLRAASDAACRARWSNRVGSKDVVLVDRPGLGYADDYTPWLVDAPVGSIVPPGRSASPTRGCSPLSQPDCLFCRLVADGDHVHAADGFVAIRDIAPPPRRTCSSSRSGTSTRSVRSTSFRTRRRAGCCGSSPPSRLPRGSRTTA